LFETLLQDISDLRGDLRGSLLAGCAGMLLDDGTDGLSEEVIGAGVEVHKKLGPGLLESAYRLPMVWALEKRGLRVEIERPLSIEFDGRVVPRAYFIDIVVGGKLILELKSIAMILPIHIAQVSTYLALSGIGVGLLMNFNVQVLRHGIKRVLHPDLPRLPSGRDSRR
jgi:GxxExxY protein